MSRGGMQALKGANMARLTKWTIGKKIAAGSIPILIIVAVGIGGLSYVLASKAVRTQVSENAPQIAAYGAMLVRGTLDRYVAEMREFASDPDVISMDWKRQEPATVAAVKRMGVFQIAIATADGATHLNDGSTTNVIDRDYFKQAIVGSVAISDIIIHKVLKKPVQVVAVPILSPQSQVLGITFAVFDAGWLSETSDKISYGKKGFAFVIDGKGTFIASPNRDDVLKQRNLVDESAKDPSLAPIAGMFGRMMKGESGYEELPYGSDRDIFGYAPVPGTSWAIAVGARQVHVFGGLDIIRNSILIVSILFIALGLLILSFVTRGIVLPIKECVVFTEMLAHNDYTQEVPEVFCKRSDEIGDLARAYAILMRNTRELVMSIQKQLKVLSGVGTTLSSSMGETASSITQISANLEGLKNRALSQSTSVTETNSTMEQITRNIKRLDAHIDEQAASVAQSSSAIEEMLANISSVTSTLQKNAENVGELAQASDEGRSSLASVSESIREVAKESESLLEISEVIQSIASQTNLLSMNAAIEAAHAGDSGKGFAVVADEIRKLAESSGEQSKTISASLRKIKDSLDGLTRSTDSVLAQFESIDARIKTVSEREQSIRNAMDEQGTGSHEILEAISQLNDITTQVKSGSTEMLEGSKEVIKESMNLGRVTEEVNRSVNEMAEGVGHITHAVNSINETSRGNKESIEALMEEVGKFKVGTAS